MSPKATKSKNLGLYPYFLNYDDPSDIPFAKLAEKLSIHPNRLRGMIRPARQNSTIYTALRKQSYGDHQIPAWFARPDEPLVYRRPATARPKVSAEKRSGEDGSRPPRRDTAPIDVAQEGSAERPSALSMRSAPPANVYRLVQPVYRPPMNPLIEEALRLIRETQDKEMRADLDQMRRRRDPPKPASFDEIMARVKVSIFIQQNKARYAAQMMFMTNLMQRPHSEPLDMEEIKEIFTKPFKEMRLKNERKAKETREALAALGEMLKDSKQQIQPPDDLIQHIKAANQEKRKSDKEAIICLAKMISENRNTKNVDLQMMEYQNRVIIENFWKNMNRERESVG